jgi:hypothetical protein
MRVRHRLLRRDARGRPAAVRRTQRRSEGETRTLPGVQKTATGGVQNGNGGTAERKRGAGELQYGR